MFFKFLPLPKLAALLHIFWPPLLFQLLFRHGVLLLRTCSLGLESPQALCRINQMQCSPSFDWNWGKQNDPTACWHQLHPRFQVVKQGKCLWYPAERVGVVTETTICVGGEGLRSLRTPINRGHPL